VPLTYNRAVVVRALAYSRVVVVRLGQPDADAVESQEQARQ